jgi:hypothetical protein
MEQAISSSKQDRIRTAHEQVDAALERLAEAVRQGKPEDLVRYPNLPLSPDDASYSDDSFDHGLRAMC